MIKVLLISLLTLSLSIALAKTNQSQGKSKYISVKDDIEKIKEDLAKIYNNNKYYDRDSWEYDGMCYGGVNDFSYHIRHYRPPQSIDISTYGFLSVKNKSKSKNFSGFEYGPSHYGSYYKDGKIEDEMTCGHFVSDHFFILDMQKSDVTKYITIIDLKSLEQTILQYPTHKEDVFQTTLSDKAYLVAGFGLCPFRKGYEGNYENFCKSFPKETKNYFGEAYSSYDSMSPRILHSPGAAFYYYVFSHDSKDIDPHLVKKALREYFLDVLSKIDYMRTNPEIAQPYTDKDIQESILALVGALMKVPDLGHEFSEASIRKRYNISKHTHNEYKKYWQKFATIK